MQVGDRLPAQLPFYVGMHHLPGDGPWTYEGDLICQLLEVLRLRPSNGRHLGAALDLKQAHRVCCLNGLVHSGVLRYLCVVEHHAVMLRDQLTTVGKYGHHSKAEQIDLDDSHVRAVVLIPLDDGTPGHRRPFNRDHRIEMPLADDHAAAVLREVAGKMLHPLANLQKLSVASVSQIKPGDPEGVLQRVLRSTPLPRSLKLRDS